MPRENIALSLILPAYDEAARLPPYLAAVRPYLDGRYGDRYEVIVVDDGSGDGLTQLLATAAADWPQLRWLRHAANCGKGAAVRSGILASCGALLLFADADGATPIEEEAALAAAIRAGADLAVGSRLLAGAGRRRARRWFRGLAGRLFSAVARRLLGVSVRDTQCGFKMFRGEAGRKLFALVHEPRYLFDLEMLVLAQRLGLKTVEVPISWNEVPGGHFHLVRELPRIARDLYKLRCRLRNAFQSQPPPLPLAGDGSSEATPLKSREEFS